MGKLEIISRHFEYMNTIFQIVALIGVVGIIALVAALWTYRDVRKKEQPDTLTKAEDDSNAA